MFTHHHHPPQTFLPEIGHDLLKNKNIRIPTKIKWGTAFPRTMQFSAMTFSALTSIKKLKLLSVIGDNGKVLTPFWPIGSLWRPQERSLKIMFFILDQPTLYLYTKRDLSVTIWMVICDSFLKKSWIPSFNLWCSLFWS